MEIDKVKQIFRNTLLLDKSRTENDAEHCWHMALGALILKGSKFNITPFFIM
ncbi:MAG: HD domain-containing protein [Spirochaetes bacterium]|nr:HD domain-containing protein [Spirochaetota bacterium]